MPPPSNYQHFTIADALAPKQRPVMLVEKLLPAGSVSIFYGYPGSLKSALIMDLTMAVATGKPYLPSMPNSGGKFPGYKTTQAPVLWIDLDNGLEVTGERVAAFARTYQADPTTPYMYMSYPSPSIQASRASSINSLTSHIFNNLPQRPGLIVLDTLLRAAHVKDENSSEMDTVLNNLHKMAEDLKCTLIMISHSKKENYGRAGNGLRGHSSIEGGVDYVFYVKRENHSDVIEIENQKARRKPIDPFSAKWTYLNDIDGETLCEARFYFEPTIATNKHEVAILEICRKIVETIEDNGSMTKSDLFNRVKGNRQNFEEALQKAVKDGKVKSKPGAYNSTIYDV
jgi:hypothetical protein